MGPEMAPTIDIGIEERHDMTSELSMGAIEDASISDKSKFRKGSTILGAHVWKELVSDWFPIMFDYVLFLIMVILPLSPFPNFGMIHVFFQTP